MKKRGFVTAYKGAITQQFTRTSWEVMGTDKCGWVLVPEVPKEVAKAQFIGKNEAETGQKPEGVLSFDSLPKVVESHPTTNVQPAQPAKTRKSKKRK